MFCLHFRQLALCFPYRIIFFLNPQRGHSNCSLPVNAPTKKRSPMPPKPIPGSIPIIVTNNIMLINNKNNPIRPERTRGIIRPTDIRLFSTSTRTKSIRSTSVIYIIADLCIRAPTNLYAGARQKFRLLSRSFTFCADLEKTRRSQSRKTAGPQPQY